MDRETLESFFSIQGVNGIALLGRKSRPYFYKSFQDLSKQQQDALLQGLFQVLESMPSGFDFFDFQFSQQRVFVYPLNPAWVLLVAVDDRLSLPIYQPAVNHFRASLTQDVNRGLSTLRVFNSPAIQTGQHQDSALAVTTPDPQPTLPALTSGEIVMAINQLSGRAANYLGKAVIVNYWKMARQEVINAQANSDLFLEKFAVERSAEIRFGADPQALDPAQIQLLQQWVARFIKRCEEVIRDFRQILASQELSAYERLLISTKPR